MAAAAAIALAAAASPLYADLSADQTPFSAYRGMWLDRFDYRYGYMGHTTQMRRPASEYFARNIWISADPEERTLPYMVEPLGDHKFFIGSDYPHAEGFVRPVEKARTALARLPESSINKILGDNAARFFGI